MGVKNYYSVNGEILAERAGTGARTDYLRDALGSITGTSDSAGAIINTYRHKPFGALLAKTGVGADPNFLWNGSSGYKSTNLSHSSHYVRARHYADEDGRWTTLDPLWPDQLSYAYVGSNPVNGIDFSGLEYWDYYCKPKCCCSVTNFSSIPTLVNNPPTRVGMDINSSASMHNILTKGKSGGQCKLVWREKSNLPYSQGGQIVPIPINMWFDVADYSSQLGQPTDTFVLPEGCPEKTAGYWKDLDPVGVGWTRNPAATLTKKLCIRIELTDGCSGQVLVKMHMFKLVLRNGVVISRYPTKKPPESAPADMANYCKYP